MTTQRTKREFKVRRQAIASRYNLGEHTADPNAGPEAGEPSLLDGMSIFHFMLRDLFAKGVRPGDRLEIVIQKQRKGTEGAR